MCEDKWSMIGFKNECPDCGGELHPQYSGLWDCYHCEKEFSLILNIEWEPQTKEGEE